METLSKRQISQIRKNYSHSSEIVKLAQMAELHRRRERAKKTAQTRKPKKYLKSTDYLSVTQFGRIMAVVSADAAKAAKRTKTLTRAIVNEMLIIVLAETGLRAGELVNLKLKDLPGHHGKDEIEVVCGKGSRDRTVGISSFCSEKLKAYVKKYHRNRSIYAPLFRSETGRVLSYNSVYAKIKNIGVAADVWVYHKKGKKTSRLSPHKFRHTYATLLLDVTDNEFLVQSQLGHQDPVTTAIYARTLSEKLRRSMDSFHGRLWGEIAKNEPKPLRKYEQT